MSANGTGSVSAAEDQRRNWKFCAVPGPAAPFGLTPIARHVEDLDDQHLLAIPETGSAKDTKCTFACSVIFRTNIFRHIHNLSRKTPALLDA
ncbi:MAG: hypothetical protein ACREYF_18305 [Gammaproteobacteria bacterium]